MEKQQQPFHRASVELRIRRSLTVLTAVEKELSDEVLEVHSPAAATCIVFLCKLCGMNHEGHRQWSGMGMNVSGNGWG